MIHLTDAAEWAALLMSFAALIYCLIEHREHYEDRAYLIAKGINGAQLTAADDNIRNNFLRIMICLTMMYVSGRGVLTPTDAIVVNPGLQSEQALTRAIGRFIVVAGLLYAAIADRASKIKRMRIIARERVKPIDDTLDAILTIGRNGNVRSFNKGAVMMFGYTPEQVLGYPLTMLMPPEDIPQYEAAFAAYQESGDFPELGRTRQITIVTKDGTERPAEMVITELVDNITGACFTAIIRDAPDGDQQPSMTAMDAGDDTPLHPSDLQTIDR